MKSLGLTKAELSGIEGHQKAAFRVLQWFAEKGPGTVYECELELGHKVASPYVKKLVEAGCLCRTGERKKTRGFSTAVVYAYKEGASFIAYLGLPPPTVRTRRVEISLLDAQVLATAKAYVLKIRATRMRSPAGAKKMALTLLRKLENLAEKLSKESKEETAE